MRGVAPWVDAFWMKDGGTYSPSRLGRAIAAARRLVAISGGAEMQHWVVAVKTGVLTTFGVAGAAGVYLAATWGDPNRGLDIALWAVAVATGVFIWLMPTERIVASPYRNYFFLTWSALDILLIATICLLDTGTASPFALLFFLTLAFASLFYPLPMVVIVGTVTVGALLVVGFLDSGTDYAQLWYFTACLTATALMCGWQARNHDRQRTELMRASRSDPLTGSLNRRGFQERLEGELDRAQRTGRPFGLILLDLDGFKGVNDEHGHAAGDNLLIWVAQRIGEAVRPMDSLGRLGGDEFAVLLPGVGRVDLEETRRRIENAIGWRAPCSVGAACFPAEGTDGEEMLSHADAELYEGKRQHSLARKDLSWATALATAADSRSNHQHSSQTAALAAAMAQRLGWQEEGVRLLRIAAMLHDIGKVGVSERVLQKTDPLTVEERQEIEMHPLIGAALVARIESVQPVAPWIRHSHENYDGSGYPDGLAGEAIPPASRIILVADAFDVMCSDRPYGRARSAEEALEELRRGSGLQFDPTCVEALAAVVESGMVPTASTPPLEV
jgi:diguanylate cyclase (GGDEF)-like protein/putative nucleotidyltransferase with HDIG domain